MHSIQDIQHVIEEANKTQEKYEELIWEALCGFLQGKKDVRSIIRERYGLQVKNIKEKASQFLFVEQKYAEVKKLERMIKSIDEEIVTAAKKGLYEEYTMVAVNKRKETFKKMCESLIQRYFEEKGFTIWIDQESREVIGARIFWSENNLIKQKK